MFEQQPDLPSGCEAMKKWKELGTFEFESALDAQSLTFDGSLKIQHAIQFERGTYSGQLPKQFDSYAVGRKIYRSKQIYEG